MCRSAAGAQFIEYETTQAGLGIWDITTGKKLTIQLVSYNYVGALLPTLFQNNVGNQIFWNNSGLLLISDLNENDWINSRQIATSSGVSYQDLKNNLQDIVNDFPAYQPVSVVYPKRIPNAEDIQSGNWDFSTDTVTLIPADNSYAFLGSLLSNLAQFGCSLQSFLQVRTYVVSKLVIKL